MGRRLGSQSVYKIVFLFVILLATFSMISAADYNEVITNSENWIDVYSGIHYANLLGIDSDFLTSANHGRILLESLAKSKNILVVSSRDEPYVFNYPDLIKTQGFSSADEIVSRNLNIDLAKDLDVQNFVIVDDSYGYNAIAVAPYAVQKHAWVFFANKINIDDIDAVLSQKNPKEVLIYGYVDREVRDALAKYSPKVIDNQDKFLDNIDITKEYLKLKDTKQVLLTNGNFIEKELMSGTQPVLFTGVENVPDEIRDYLKSSNIEVGVLVGNELIGAATNIRRSAGISVMVKFARGARVPTAGVSAVEGLDLFPLPAPKLNLSIYSAEYNKMTKQLEVTYKSDANTPMYLKGTVTLVEDDGTKTVLGDAAPVFIAPGSYLTLTYPAEVGNLDNLRAQFFVVYGETQSSLDRILNAELKVSSTDVIDQCEIQVKKVSYNKQKAEFDIDVKVTKGAYCWMNGAIDGLTVGYNEQIVSTDGAYRIKGGDTGTLVIKQELLDTDLAKNQFVNVVINYGEKETNLPKTLRGKFELNIKSLATITYVAMGFALSAGLFFFLFAYRRRREKSGDFDF